MLNELMEEYQGEHLAKMEMHQYRIRKESYKHQAWAEKEPSKLAEKGEDIIGYHESIMNDIEQAAASFRAIQHLYNNGIFWDEVNGQKRFNYCRFGSHLKDMDILESEDGPDDHSEI